MAAFIKFNNLVDGLFKGQLNLATDGIQVMLTNTQPDVTKTKYADISSTELANGNGYATGGSAVAGAGTSNATGTQSVSAQATTFTSNTGMMGPFRYAVYYDKTTGYLMGYYDYGAVASLNGANAETFTIAPQGNVLLTAA